VTAWVDVDSVDGDEASLAFVELDRVAACVVCDLLARDAFPFDLTPPVVAARVLPGKACAASAENAPVSVTVPASSQRLQCERRCSAASRERAVGEVLM